MISQNTGANEAKKQKRERFYPSHLGLFLSLPKQVIETPQIHSPLLKQNIKKTKKRFIPEKPFSQLEKINLSTIQSHKSNQLQEKSSFLFHDSRSRKNSSNLLNAFNDKSKKKKQKYCIIQNKKIAFYQTMTSARNNKSKSQISNNQSQLNEKNYLNLTFFPNNNEKKTIQKLESPRAYQKVLIEKQNPQESINQNFPRFDRLISTFYSSKNSEFKTIGVLRKTIIGSHNGFYSAYFKKKKADEPSELEITKAPLSSKLVSIRPNAKKNSLYYNLDCLGAKKQSFKKFMEKKQRRRSRNVSRSEIRGWDIRQDDVVAA